MQLAEPRLSAQSMPMCCRPRLSRVTSTRYWWYDRCRNRATSRRADAPPHKACVGTCRPVPWRKAAAASLGCLCATSGPRRWRTMQSWRPCWVPVRSFAVDDEKAVVVQPVHVVTLHACSLDWSPIPCNYSTAPAPLPFKSIEAYRFATFDPQRKP